MPEVSVCFPVWCATSSSMHSAYAIAANGWSTTWLPSSFRLGFAARCVVGTLHGVVGHFGFCPLPVSTSSGSRICAIATGALPWSAGTVQFVQALQVSDCGYLQEIEIEIAGIAKIGEETMAGGTPVIVLAD